MDALAKRELCEAITAGGACVAGLTLAQIMPILSFISLMLSILAGLLSIVTHLRSIARRRKDAQ